MYVLLLRTTMASKDGQMRPWERRHTATGYVHTGRGPDLRNRPPVVEGSKLGGAKVSIGPDSTAAGSMRYAGSRRGPCYST